ncbi:hypothetical protein BpHYR1_034537, partial [Brachionus plicatilis]
FFNHSTVVIFRSFRYQDKIIKTLNRFCTILVKVTNQKQRLELIGNIPAIYKDNYWQHYDEEQVPELFGKIDPKLSRNLDFFSIRVSSLFLLRHPSKNIKFIKSLIEAFGFGLGYFYTLRRKIPTSHSSCKLFLNLINSKTYSKIYFYLFEN